MPFHPPRPLPETERPDAIELGLTGGISEEAKPEYRDTAPKSGTEFDDETAALFRSLDSFHKLDYEEQKVLLNDAFRPYLRLEQSFPDRLRDSQTAPRALELLRQMYTRCGFGDEDRKQKSAYKDTWDFSPEEVTRWVVAALDDLDQTL